MPLFVRLKAVNATAFRLKAISAGNFQVTGRQSCFFRLNAVNVVTFPDKGY